MGLFYCYDILGSTHASLETEFKFLGEDFEFYFGILYSVTSLPNIIMPFFGWMLNARLGIPFMYVIYGSFIMIGQFILCLGCQYRSIFVMIIGRTIFGLGYQLLCTCKNQMLMHWFFKNDVSFPFGLCQGVIDFSKFMCFYLSPRIVKTVI